MELPYVWFAIVAFFWTGFFVLEGFDFGVGALHRRIGRDEIGRRVVINTVGPVWDGNEVWLVVAGASMFAAFPFWYASAFSALYIPLWLVLAALILRGVSFEFRGKSERRLWRGTWSWALTIGSVFAPLLLGIGLGDMLAGLPIDANGDFTGTLLDLFTPYGLVLGATLLCLCLLHGAAFLSLRTTDAVRDRAQGAVRALAIPAAVLVTTTAIWTVVQAENPLWAGIAAGVTVLAALTAVVLGMLGIRQIATFVATTVSIGGTVATLFLALAPRLLVSTTDAANTLTVANASASAYSLQVMTIVAVVAVPIVLGYQAWTYYVFRRRVKTPTEAPS